MLVYDPDDAVGEAPRLAVSQIMLNYLVNQYLVIGELRIFYKTKLITTTARSEASGRFFIQSSLINNLSALAVGIITFCSILDTTERSDECLPLLV